MQPVPQAQVLPHLRTASPAGRRSLYLVSSRRVSNLGMSPADLTGPDVASSDRRSDDQISIQ
jgi:hypothetical protein